MSDDEADLQRRLLRLIRRNPDGMARVVAELEAKWPPPYDPYAARDWGCIVID